MSETSAAKLRRLTEELRSAHAERNRLFEAMCRPNISDEKRDQYAAEYRGAAKHFDKLRAEFIR